MSHDVQPLNWSDLAPLPRRQRSGHKGDYGRVRILGGGPGMGGALALACLAAYRVGAGLVTALGHPDQRLIVATWVPEALWEDWPVAELLPSSGGRTVLAIGPGLGQGLAAHNLVQAAGRLEIPQVWDADALNLLARLGPDILSTPADRYFTPHPGEAARLLGISTALVQADRQAAIRALQARYGGSWILKGEGSLIAHEDVIWHCPLGNPGMATGGSGDVLTGMLAGLLAQGLTGHVALPLAVCAHARAGDRAADALGEASVLARDLVDHLPATFQELNRP